MQKVQEMLSEGHKRVRREVNSAKTVLEGPITEPDPPSDEYCPHCDNQFVLDAKTPTPALNIEGEDARVDARMIKDDRLQAEQRRTIFNVKNAADRLG